MTPSRSSLSSFNLAAVLSFVPEGPAQGAILTKALGDGPHSYETVSSTLQSYWVHRQIPTECRTALTAIMIARFSHPLSSEELKDFWQKRSILCFLEKHLNRVCQNPKENPLYSTKIARLALHQDLLLNRADRVEPFFNKINPILKKDPTFMLTAIQQSCYAFDQADPQLKNDEGFAIRAIAISQGLSSILLTHSTNKKVILAVIAKKPTWRNPSFCSPLSTRRRRSCFSSNTKKF